MIDSAPTAGPPDDWWCIRCGRGNPVPVGDSAEAWPCGGCGATWRDRVVIAVTLVGLSYGAVALPSVTPDWSRRGLGIADSQAVASALSGLFDYVNGHLHKFPEVNLCDVPVDLHGDFEFVTCSDVLEHVAGCVDDAISGLASLIRPGGFAVVTVPAVGTRPPGEYYEGLADFQVLPAAGRGGSPSLLWTDSGGQAHRDDSPELHGGDGLVVAFRLFTKKGLIELMNRHGFTAFEPEIAFVRELGCPKPKDSIVVLGWREPR